MLAMEMKSCGAYVSRGLSFKQAEVNFILIFVNCYNFDWRLIELNSMAVFNRLCNKLNAVVKCYI